MTAAVAVAPRRSIGKFSVIRKLGEGTTSTVYLCHDEFAARDVAVKLVSLARLSPRTARIFRKLLLTEASLIGKLEHPHIVQIHDAVVEQGLGYIVMEYVAGGTLEQYCEPTTLLPWRSALEIVFKCCRALEFACGRGVIHRDIKPANVLVSSGTDIKITDFGTAMHATLDSTMVTGVGSPAYMSPEQVQDEDVGPQSDIYSLGVVMYQLLCGRLPFAANNHFGMLYQILHAEPLPIGVQRGDLPPELVGIVHRAMQRDRRKRFQNWDEFAAAVLKASGQAGGSSAATFPDVEKFAALRELSFFQDFADAEIWEALRIARWEDLPAEHHVLADGDHSDFFCLIVRGEVRVEKRHRLLNLLRAGDCFGEMAYLEPERGNLRGADVITTQACRLVSIHARDLRQASRACQHHFDRAFIRVLIGRLELANNRMSAAHD